ncbi:MAG TPA: hypothetical protein VK663_10845 [Burkholderiales bacterium]|nr:hypothetical protein [Burkholderiales bacterium]
MSTSSETALELKPGSRGRKSADGGEETISFQPIKEGVAEVMKLYKKAELAVADFNAAAKSVAEKGNINTASLKKLIKSSAKGKFKDTQRAIDQQSVLFETVGEVSGGSDMDVN